MPYKLLGTDSYGEITKMEASYFGGEFNFWEKLKMSGIGSPKLIYENGIHEFDQLKRGVENEIFYINFELLKNGLLVRGNINQRIKVIGIRLDELLKISLIAYRIEFHSEKFQTKILKIVHKGTLDFTLINGPALTFKIITVNFNEMLNYFNKSEFKDLFNYSVSLSAPEEDSDAYKLGKLIKFLT